MKLDASLSSPAVQSWSLQVAAWDSCRIEVVLWGHVGSALVARHQTGVWCPPSCLSLLYLHLHSLPPSSKNCICRLGQQPLAWRETPEAAHAPTGPGCVPLWLRSFQPRQGTRSSPQLMGVDAVFHLQPPWSPLRCSLLCGLPLPFFHSMPHTLSSSTSPAAAFT